MGTPFGVELPENLGNAAESAGSSTDSAPETKVSSEASTPETIQQILDLDKQDRFRFADKEWTPKELRSSVMAHSDYSRKTQELAQARKYADNFEADLEKIVANPNLIAEMKRVGYPPAYIKVAQRAVDALNPQREERGTNPGPEIPSAVKQQLEDLMGWKESVVQQNHQAEVQRIAENLDSWFDKYGKKFGDADPDAVLNRAYAISDAGKKVTEKVVETLFKQHHEAMNAKFSSKYKAKVDGQLDVNSKGREAGVGGGAPGAAPKTNKTLKEAKEAWLNDLKNSA